MAVRIIHNARVVLRDEVVVGSVVIDGDRIAAVDAGANGSAAAEDWRGDFLLAGLVELHTDNLEKHLMPRPGVEWNADSAMIVHDAQCAAAGITTVLDSIVIGDLDSDGLRARTQHAAIAALRDCSADGVLRIAHYLHLRCEIATPGVVGIVDRYIDEPGLKLVSVMDHTPGQRQFRDLVKYRQYAARNGMRDEAAFSRLLETQRELHHRVSETHRQAIVERARAHGIPLASHDDTELEHIAQAQREGVVLSEFPTTEAAARAARAQGMGIIMGAPNLVKGGSHSGNASAAELARLDLLDILSSDYVPASLLAAAFMLHHDEGWTLPEAIATVTRNAAESIGMNDRGAIEVGRRADLIRVRLRNGAPLVLETIYGGLRSA